MSEYQFYEFQAIDRPLNSEDQAYIRSLSSRVQLTSINAQFTYYYSGLRGKPEEVLERCFDMMVYIANFGVRRLMIRFPKALVDAKSLAPYCVEGCISVETTTRSLILDIQITQEAYYTWIDEEEYLADLMPIREEILRGDFRVLYLAWLAAGFAEYAPFDPDESVEPPVPAGLKKLSPALKAFADFFMVDEDLIAAAAAESSSQLAQQQAEPIADWLAKLSEKERNAYLLRVIEGEAHVGVELKQYLRKKFGKVQKLDAQSPERTLGELVAIAQEQRETRTRKAEQAAAKARQKYLKELAPKADQIWREVDRLIDLKQAKPYEEAVAHLVDLHDLAESQGTLMQFQQRIQQMRQQYSSRSGLLSRLQKAGLLP
ncbi:MAG: hypothetical protein MUF49_19970 [Oculatellaceae cyanobacterium Prado106]|nr:hypothetical protein [Oculatellaceae cyanobacterium Prado106]